MIYDLLAPFYDAVNSEIDYSKWADFITEILNRHNKIEGENIILDLGCGTGNMTLELAERGYDMIGVDYSVQMLDVARNRAEKLKLDGKILWLCQDMSDFELYGTVDAAVSCLDCINHITDSKELDKCFDLLHNYIYPDGLLIFDINGKAKFENVYDDKNYIIEEDGLMLVWQNSYNQKSGMCDFYITAFNRTEDGLYERFDVEQREKMYTLKSIKRRLHRAGFEFIGAYSDFNFKEATDLDQRIYIVARCIKE